MNIEFKAKKMSQNPDVYWVYLKRDGKVLEIRDFIFGMSNPTLEIVLECIADDYTLLKSSPTLDDFIINVGEHEDIEEDYKTFKIYMNECEDFFTEEELEFLITQ